MATYYVGSGGSDASAGTSWGARWLTIGKALGASGMASGDTLYIAPGTYREVVTVAMTSPTGTTNIIGDVTGANTSGSAGAVVWTAWTTNDTTAASGSAPVALSGRDYLSFSNIQFVSGSGACISGDTATSTNITLTDCYLWATSGVGVSHTTAAGSASTWSLDRCTIYALGSAATAAGVVVTLTRHTADYDCSFTIQNSVVFATSTAIGLQSTGAGTGFGGGVVVKNCTLFGSHGVRVLDANVNTTTPGANVINCFINAQTCVRANTSGQVTESYNVLVGGTARTNVTAGTGSQTAYAPMVHFGQERLWGAVARPHFTPTSSSPLLGFGGSSPPSVDLMNRDRPSGGASTSAAAGAFERHDFGAKETGTTDAGSVALKLTGPGDHDLLIPVDATSTTISVKVYYDTNHGTGSKPQAQLLANGEIGFAGETVTATAGTSTWDTLTFAAFTPSAKSYVTLRLRSRAAAGNGYAIFDTITVS